MAPHSASGLVHEQPPAPIDSAIKTEHAEMVKRRIYMRHLNNFKHVQRRYKPYVETHRRFQATQISQQFKLSLCNVTLCIELFI